MLSTPSSGKVSKEVEILVGLTNSLRSLTTFFALVFCFAVVIIVQDDQVFEHSVTSNQAAVWYSENWWEAPYTHWKLSNLPSKSVWVENAIHSEQWLVKETVYENTVFWAVLARKDLVKGVVK